MPSARETDATIAKLHAKERWQIERHYRQDYR